MAAGSSILGALIEKWMGGTPKKPEVPEAPNIDLSRTLFDVDAANLANLPGASQLASRTNAANFSERQKYLQGVPGFGLLNQEADILHDWSQGLLSPDIQQSVQDTQAAKAWGGGVSGSPFSHNWLARDLGLTSLGLQQQATSMIPSFVNSSANLTMPHLFDPASTFATTPEALQTGMFNENNRFSTEWLRNQIAALPDPSKKLLADAVASIPDWINQMGRSVVGSYAGMIGGGVGGGGGVGMNSSGMGLG